MSNIRTLKYPNLEQYLYDKWGNFYSVMLFKEFQPRGKSASAYHPVYTLGKADTDDMPSAYKIYMEATTEYEAAIMLFGSYVPWKKLLESARFMEYLEEWREEKVLAMQTIGYAGLIEQASGNASAAKWLAEHGTMPGRFDQKSKSLEKKDKIDKDIKDADVDAALKRLGRL